MKFFTLIALVASASAIKLTTVPAGDIAQAHLGPDQADTAPALCVDKATCGDSGSKVAYGPYKADNGGITGNGHHLVFDHSGK